MARLFVALPLPGRARAELTRVSEALRPVVAEASWTPPENMHCTVSFLGAVDPERIPSIAAALGAAVTGIEGFQARLGHVGGFPRLTRPRVLWVGLEADGGALEEAAASVHAALQPAGFEPDARGFHPHVTLARLRHPRAVTTEVVVEPVPVPVDRLVLFESHLGGGRPARYEALATFPFLG